MARGQNNRGGSNSSRSNSNRGRNNNPEGRNQYSGGVTEMVRDQPIKAALGAAAAVGAGVFLWSRRNQISEQLSNLSDQIGEWSENRSWSGGNSGGEMDDTGGFASDSSISQRGMSETGGGNASLGASSGGGGSAGSATGRGRTRQAPTG